MDQDPIYNDLKFLYGAAAAETLRARLQEKLDRFPTGLPGQPDRRLTGRDSVLITYGNMVQNRGESPLETLAAFLQHTIKDIVSTVHLLPFYPYSSDDGFSVIDYRAVDPEVGSWKDVSLVGRDFRLMFDAVINHISAESSWFQGFLQGDPQYRDYFVSVDPAADLTAVFRPRALPLLTEVATAGGPRHVWTTFSSDQIDLNYANPDVLLEIIDLLLFYVAKGAELIRLDAIAFMWKEIGTSSIHLPQTHRIIQLMRSVLDLVAPYVVLITETNVPHEENVSYFGNGFNEAQMVYNFSLPPLTLHAFHTGNAEILSRWAASLTLPSNRVTFFNFLASHDGIGLTPARGLLPETAVTAIADRVQQLGGLVSYKNNPDGTRSPYELNVNYLDALGDPDSPSEPLPIVAQRFLTSQAIMLAMRGVPGIYFHSLFGSRGWPEGVAQTGRNRTINRQKLDVATLTRELEAPGSLRRRVFSGYRAMLVARAAAPAFHPYGRQEILNIHPAMFALRRTAPNNHNVVLCLHSVAERSLTAALPQGQYVDLLTQRPFTGGTEVNVQPYQTLWLQELPD